MNTILFEIRNMSVYQWKREANNIDIRTIHKSESSTPAMEMNVVNVGLDFGMSFLLNWLKVLGFVTFLYICLCIMTSVPQNRYRAIPLL